MALGHERPHGVRNQVGIFHMCAQRSNMLVFLLLLLLLLLNVYVGRLKEQTPGQHCNKHANSIPTAGLQRIRVALPRC